MACCRKKTAKEYIVRNDWSDDVKKALNMFIAENGKDSENYDDTTYVVFDFDNTSAVFDVEEQLFIYQLQRMAFVVTPDNIGEVLRSQLSNLDADLSHLGYGKGSYNDWVSDIETAYKHLYEKYGPFPSKGLTDAELEKVYADEWWQEFAPKMRAMYDLIYDNESATVAYPWITYWFTGMTPKEVYDLAYASHTYFGAVDTSEVTWTSPENIDSKVGVVSYTWTSGIQVTENIKELMKAFNDNGIKVWVCSASSMDVVQAGIDAFGLHDYISGLLAMTNKLENGVYINEYDYETGCSTNCLPGGQWTVDTIPEQAQTHGVGKVISISNILNKKYGHGPAAGFMDSTGDYNFCTEFKTLKLVVCFNRANRKIAEGGGVIAELAMYQKNTLGYDLNSANKSGDTFYVLQGRDENGKRTFRNSNKTLLYGSDKEKLFKNEDNEKQLKYMTDHKMTTEDIINTFAIKTPADAENNVLGIPYGFLKEYSGYHTHD